MTVTATKHTLNVDGYGVGDRLLEGVYFHVDITETEDNLEITKVDWERNSYTDRINMASFVDEIKDDVQSNIDYIKASAKKEGKTIKVYLDEWDAQVAADPTWGKLTRIDILNEV